MERIGSTNDGMTELGIGITRARIRNAMIIIHYIEHGGMAIGTAIHPTTQLLAWPLEDCKVNRCMQPYHSHHEREAKKKTWYNTLVCIVFTSLFRIPTIEYLEGERIKLYRRG